MSINNILIFILITQIISIDPNCEIIAENNQKIFNGNQQIRALQLSNFFRGFNLQYTIDSQSSAYTLIPPFYLSNSLNIVPPIKQDMNLTSFDIVQENKIWKNQGSVLVTQNPTSFMVRFGQITKQINIIINDTPSIINHSTYTNCFDLIAFANDWSIVDCQTQNVSNPLDVFYLVDSTGNNKKFTFDAVARIKSRKTLLYQQADESYVLSVSLEFENTLFSEQTFITIYRIDDQTQSLSFVYIIDANALGLKKLQITDINIDANNNIYISDLNEGLIRFNYLRSNEIINIQKYKISGQSIQKISSIVNFDGRIVIVSASYNSIFQIDWTQTSPILIRTYEVSSQITKIKDLQINNHLITLQSDINYYFYRIGETRLKNLMYVVQSKNSLILLDQSTPHAILVGYNNTLSYIGSNGYLKIDNPQLQESVIITAQSGTKSCSVTFDISLIKDDTQIYTIKSLPNNLSIQSPTSLYIPFDNYYIGSKLQYSTIDYPGVQYKLQEVQPISIAGDLINSQILLTYQTSDSEYYRVTKKSGSAITSQLCSLDQTNSIKCVASNTLAYTGSIINAKVFQAILNSKSIPFLAFTGSLKPNIINFVPLMKTDQQIDNIVLDINPVNFVINKYYLFIIISQLSEIRVFKRVENTFIESTSISELSFTAQQIAQLKKFKPQQLLLSQIDSGVLFIKNLGSVIIIKYSEYNILYLSRIQIVDQPSYLDQWKIVIGNYNMLVILGKSSGNTIYQFGLYDIYNPLKEKTIDLLGDQIAEPIHAINSLGSNSVYLKTLANGKTYMTNILMGKSAIMSNYYSQEIDSSSVFLSATLKSSSVIQIISSNIKSLRIYESPSLLVSAVNQDSFQKEFNYGFKIQGQGNNIIFNGKLKVFNYQTTIKQSSKSNNKISLPKNAKQKVIQLISDANFQGSIASYQIDCSYCKNKITFVDHVSINSTTNPIQNPNQFINFGDQKQVWALTDNFIYILNEDNQIAAPPVSLQVSSDVKCTNWGLLSTDMIIVFCKSLGGQFFIPVSILSKQSIVVLDQVPIPGGYRIQNLLKMVGKQDRIFLLDNNKLGNGNGIIRIFKGNFINDTYTLEFDYTIDYETFGAPNGNIINDFNILETSVGVSTEYILLATLSATGFGYGVYDPKLESFIFKGDGHLINLFNDPVVSKYILDDNNFLQILLMYQVLRTSIDPSVNIYSIIFVVSSGAHMHLDLSFTYGSYIEYTSLNLVNSYNKYGNQVVLNWAQGTYVDINRINNFVIAYLNTTSNNITMSIYELKLQQQQNPINFRGSLSQKLGSLEQLTGTIYRTSKDQKFIVKDQNKSVLYRIDPKTYLIMTYNTPGDFKVIKLIAKNDYSQAIHEVQVEFEFDKKGLKWYFIIMIILGSLLIIGLAYTTYKFYKRKQEERKKVSLLSEEEQT